MKCRVLSVEHLLSALEQCGVDNARIELEGGHEVPVVDGSAMGWCIEVQKVGVMPAAPPGDAEARVPRMVHVPRRVVTVSDGPAFITLYPEQVSFIGTTSHPTPVQHKRVCHAWDLHLVHWTQYYCTVIVRGGATLTSTCQ